VSNENYSKFYESYGGPATTDLHDTRARSIDVRIAKGINSRDGQIGRWLYIVGTYPVGPASDCIRVGGSGPHRLVECRVAGSLLSVSHQGQLSAQTETTTIEFGPFRREVKSRQAWSLADAIDLVVHYFRSDGNLPPTAHTQPAPLVEANPSGAVMTEQATNLPRKTLLDRGDWLTGPERIEYGLASLDGSDRRWYYTVISFPPGTPRSVALTTRDEPDFIQAAGKQDQLFVEVFRNGMRSICAHTTPTTGGNITVAGPEGQKLGAVPPAQIWTTSAATGIFTHYYTTGGQLPAHVQLIPAPLDD